MRISFTVIGWVVSVNVLSRYQTGLWVERPVDGDMEEGIGFIPGAWRWGLRAVFPRQWVVGEVE